MSDTCSLLIRGIHRTTTLEDLAQALSAELPLISATIVRDGDPDRPWALCSIGADPITAAQAVRRLERIPIDGALCRITCFARPVKIPKDEELA